MTSAVTTKPDIYFAPTVDKATQSRLDLAAKLDVPQGLELIDQDQALDLLATKSRSDVYAIIRESKRILGWTLFMEMLDFGGSRQVYAEPASNAVVKAPLFPDNLCVNQLEVAYYEQDAYYGHPVVPCRLLWMSTGCPLVLMEKIDTKDSNSTRMPGWGVNSDGGQIARSALLKNRWAAYDAAVPMMNSDVHRNDGYYIGGNADYKALVPDEHRIWLQDKVFPVALMPY